MVWGGGTQNYETARYEAGTPQAHNVVFQHNVGYIFGIPDYYSSWRDSYVGYSDGNTITNVFSSTSLYATLVDDKTISFYNANYGTGYTLYNVYIE